MNWNKANKVLSGIDRLFNIFQESEGLSSIERDLLLRRIQDLYEVVLKGDFEEIVKRTEKPKLAPVKEMPKPVWPPKVTEKPKPITPKPVPKPISKPVVERPKAETPKVETPKPIVVEKPKEIVYEPINDNSAEIEELFEFKIATDLSEKLSASAIADLKTSMGINERFLTISELFKGNKAQYDDAIDTLNSFDDFEQAKNYITRILIPEFDWTSDKKINQAKTFVKKVRRRYL